MKINIKKGVLAGVLGTVAITIVATYGAPMMGLPKMVDKAPHLSDIFGVWSEE